MQVTGIGISFGGCPAMSAPGGAALPAGGVVPSGINSISQTAAPAETLPTGMQALQELMHDFTSAEILLMLMLMAASRRKDDSDCGGSAAVGLLAGFALGSQFGQQPQIDLPPAPPIEPASPVDSQFDIQA